MTRLTQAQYVAMIMARVKGAYDWNVELLSTQYPTWQDYFCWVVAMLEADFILQGCNQKDLAGILLQGFQAFTCERAEEYIGDQYTNIINGGGDDAYIEQGIDELDKRIRDILNDNED